MQRSNGGLLPVIDNRPSVEVRVYTKKVSDALLKAWKCPEDEMEQDHDDHGAVVQLLNAHQEPFTDVKQQPAGVDCDSQPGRVCYV